MAPDVSSLEAAIRPIDARLKPVANSPIDIGDPEWVAKARRSDPFARAGVNRADAEALLMTIIDGYADGSDDEREAIRGVFRRYPSFAWAVHLPQRPVTIETLRQELLLFSIQDQGQDSRDAILQLQYLIGRGLEAGLDVAKLRADVGALSSPIDRFGMGSTRTMLIGQP